MTANQLRYWELEEAKRSNQVREIETERSNRAKETETNRANLAKEQETQRHNQTTEMIDAAGTTAKVGQTVATVVGSLAKLLL